MLDLLRSIHSPLTLASGILAALLLLVPRARSAVLAAAKWASFMLRAPYLILAEVNAVKGEVNALKGEVAVLKTEVAGVKYEVQTNSGGSMKDAVIRQEAHRRDDFRNRPRPCFECDVHGRNLLVSEAYCALLHVDAAELAGLNWIQFVFAEDRPRYVAAFREAAGGGYVFRDRARLVDSLSRPVGLWEMRAHPVGVAEPHLYSGQLLPADDAARQIASAKGWPML